VVKKGLFIVAGLVTGILVAYFVLFLQKKIVDKTPLIPVFQFNSVATKREVIGFLPYWLLDSATKDYSPYITTLTYFGLTVDENGNILKMTNPQETEPGWLVLSSNKLNNIFSLARKKKIKLSLLIFSGDSATIEKLIANPRENADRLVESVAPIMEEYGFEDLNLDIENVNGATEEERNNYVDFVKEIKAKMLERNLGTLTLEVTADDMVKKKLIDPQKIAIYVDKLVIMAYDYHFPGSFVTGPVAPLGGAGTIAEYDIRVAVEKALEIMPPGKLILGAPLYGYEWETIDDVPRSAVIPGSALTASNQRAEELSGCPDCVSGFDEIAKEAYVIFKNKETGVYHQIFFPDMNSMQEKIAFVDEEKLGGIALWALGYEGKTILEPLVEYLR